MASSGEVIQWSNFSHSYADYYHIGGKAWNGTGYMYISAPSFMVGMHVSGALWSTAELLCRFDYYDWANNTWVTGSSLTASARGSGSSDDKRYYHLWNGSNSDDDSRHNVHYWRVYVHTVNTGNNRSVEADFTVGGAGCMSEAQYNSHCQNKLMVSAGRLGGGWLHWTDQQPNDAEALSYFNWASGTGTLITASYADKIIPKSWV